MFASSGICDCYCFWCFVVNIMSKKYVLRFTLKELNALIQDENANVVLQRSIRKLPLQPYCLSDLQGSVHEMLDANLAKFDNELKGILLSYKNIKIVKNIANIMYDDSRLYLTIQADFYLFRPEVGCVLRGIVNKRSADHIGCLVHKAFNVSIPRPECETDGDWQGYYVEIGQEVTFRVESLDLTGSLPYMLGYLLDVGSLSVPANEINDEQKTTKKEDIVAAMNKLNGFLDKYEDADAATTEHKKKKKHKKYEDLDSKTNVQDSVFVKHEKYDSILEKDNQEHVEDCSVLKTPKKKKIKNTDQIAPIKQEEQAYRIDTKHYNQQEEEQPHYEKQTLHSDSFDHLNSTTDLKKKKRKYGEAFYDNNDENYSFSAQNESVKHKKKKSKKEKHAIEMPDAEEIVEDFSVDTSQEIATQDKKRKKKKKRDVTEETSKDFREETEFHTTDDFDRIMPKDRPLATSPYGNTIPEKKGKKEKHAIEMPDSEEIVEDFSVDTSQEIATQDKKRKKKKKRDVTEETSKDFREDTEFHKTDDSDHLMPKDRYLATSPYSNTIPEELIKEMQFSKDPLKKLSKKVKPLVSAEFVTSTPVEHKTKKENKFSDTASRSKFSVVTGADSHSDFKQTNLLQSMNHFSLMDSPILKDKYSKKEYESSPSVQDDTVPVKVKKLKKEKRLGSSQQSPDKSISEAYQHSGSHHVLNHPERNLSWSDTENLMGGATPQLSSSDTTLTNTKQKAKVRESTEKLSKHLIKNSLESPVESKVKMTEKECHLSIKKKDIVVNDVKKTPKTYSKTNNGGGGGSDSDGDHGNNSYNQCGVSGKPQESDRLVEHMADIKRQSSITRKSSTPPMNATSSLVPGGNTSEDDSSEEDNILKSIPKLGRTPISERSKHSEVNAINQSFSQTSRSSDRACSPDSGFSLSATSAEKDSNNLMSRDSKSEADSIYSVESPKDGRPVKEKGKVLPKTPKRKKIAEAEEGSNLTIKHKIKKEKESPISKSSRRKTDSKSPLRDDASLEAERKKILAAMIKKLEAGDDEDLPMKDESHKPVSSSAVKAKQQSKEEDTMSDSDIDTFKSKKMHKKRESNKLKFIKSGEEVVDSMQQLDPISYFKPAAERLSALSTATAAGKKELDGNRNCLGEGNPVTVVQAKISGKTPRRKSTTGTEGSSSKPVTKTPVKTKEKVSPNKTKVPSSCKSDEGNSLEEESAGVLAERLLEEFMKRTSL